MGHARKTLFVQRFCRIQPSSIVLKPDLRKVMLLAVHSDEFGKRIHLFDFERVRIGGLPLRTNMDGVHVRSLTRPTARSTAAARTPQLHHHVDQILVLHFVIVWSPHPVQLVPIKVRHGNLAFPILLQFEFFLQMRQGLIHLNFDNGFALLVVGGMLIPQCESNGGSTVARCRRWNLLRSHGRIHIHKFHRRRPPRAATAATPTRRTRRQRFRFLHVGQFHLLRMILLRRPQRLPRLSRFFQRLGGGGADGGIVMHDGFRGGFAAAPRCRPSQAASGRFLCRALCLSPWTFAGRRGGGEEFDAGVAVGIDGGRFGRFCGFGFGGRAFSFAGRNVVIGIGIGRRRKVRLWFGSPRRARFAGRGLPFALGLAVAVVLRGGILVGARKSLVQRLPTSFRQRLAPVPTQIEGIVR
mmetsp:Transcript_9010/g.19452  ORF Transcript_9010/g.19452 Transcript_9010/m.19452 type:complete len:411 (-) Transcript_9010:1176-2408(-)